MNEAQKYGPLINEKFREFSFPDVDTTWPEMKAILDREMPEKKKKRRFLFWLFFLGLLAVSLVCLAIYHNRNNRVVEKEKTDAAKTSQVPTDKKPAAVTAAPVNKSQTVPGQNSKVNEGKRQEKTSETGSQLVTSSNQQQNIDKKAPAKSVQNGIEQAQQTTISFGDTFNTGAPDEISPDQQLPNNGEPLQQLNNEKIQSNSVIATNADLHSLSSGNFLENAGKTTVRKIAERQNFRVTGADTTAFRSLALSQPVLNLVKDSLNVRKLKQLQKGKGWVIGAAISYNLPVSNQEMSTVNINGKRNSLIDFLPSLYVQYHFNSKWHLESSFQFSSPQYIANHKLSSQFTDLDPNKKEENAIWLDKLYYLNVPFSVHYSPLPQLTIGTGIQYSYLRRSIFNNEIATWENGPNGWEKTSSVKEVQIRSNAAIKKGKPNGNGNGGNNGNGGGNGNGNGNGNGGNNNGNGNNGGNNGNNGGNNGNGNSGSNGNNGGGSSGSGNNGNNGGNSSNGGNNGNGNLAAPASFTRIDTVAHTLKSSDWRLLFDINYSWKRFNVGCRFNFGLNNYINTRSGNYVLPVKDRNEALQFYLRYHLFDKRRKS